MMNITGSRDGKVFFIDNDKVMIAGKMYYEKAPQNLAQPDAYSLLGDGFDINTAIEDVGNCHRQKVKCDNWDDNRWNEVSGGIHFFLTKYEAENY